MDINDKYVLEMINKLIAIDRLNKAQILQMVNLVSLSNDINDLKDNLEWESLKSYHWNIKNNKKILLIKLLNSLQNCLYRMFKSIFDNNDSDKKFSPDFYY